MAETLNNYGMIPRKSLILKYPDIIPNEYHKDFIRGYFDGDGHVEKSGYDCRIVSTENFCITVKGILSECGISSYIYKHPNCISTTRTLIINKKENALKFLYYIYNNAELYLNRKYEKYLEIANSKFKLI